ncbi:transcriptional regulator with XRE-family HTH domain [Mucilaginibacter sp. UYP25]|uniref:helix-turn-helix domain-containing protein n=1 Tax=unclassified Mucilaginibacter TaxID=2617802 RepID=UPI00339226D3
MAETTQNIGRKISRIRELRGMKQEALAAELGISQQAVSKLEQSSEIEESALEKIASALGVSVDAIKNYSDEAVIYNIQNNYEGSNNGASNFGPANYMNYQCTFNPIDKLVELFTENKKLYERLLATEKEKNELLKNM